ncbi:RNA recognition motif domain [Macleaya cordata]|uniref:RNA recognition motif domain n=1 Tax=Macleaya cordata TaxID=56857 RepID=A0A200PP25_MACCD|nr:RNA recognition motif domain [Macleaya cordata]
MSSSKEASEVENCDFKWGTKRGIGGKRKEVQFYESFTYDGDEYFLYDCVYLYKEGEPEPYIGKIIKIWEQPVQKKKVKVLWFFRPIEILNYLGDDEALQNELFLASGEGLGLANINPLEAIAGKCNVVCTSKNDRNQQPSEEELRMADYIFHRTFNVSTLVISDKIDEKIAGIEDKFIYKRNNGQKSSNISKLDTGRTEEDGKVGVPENSVGREKPDISVIKENEQVPLPADTPFSHAGVESNGTANTVLKEENALAGKEIPIKEADSGEGEGKIGKISINQVPKKEKMKSVNGLDESDRPSKKARLDNSVKSSKELQPTISTPLPLNKDTNEARVEKKLRVDSDEDYVGASETMGSASEDIVGDSPVQDKSPTKKVKLDEKKVNLPNGKLSKPAATAGTEKDNNTDGQTVEVSRRPLADRSKWFKGLAWEERMETADDQGTLVLLENLDPAYTSAEVEDIIWHGFRENCTAKVVQKTAISSPHSGQAFVIFKTRDAAEMAIKKLDEGCLMLPNGRPLVASRGSPPKLSGKSSTLVGHLFIDKIKLQTQREEIKRAVSTSHCSQPNTIEYEMALEWCLLQTRADKWWKEFYMGMKCENLGPISSPNEQNCSICRPASFGSEVRKCILVKICNLKTMSTPFAGFLSNLKEKLILLGGKNMACHYCI